MGDPFVSSLIGESMKNNSTELPSVKAWIRDRIVILALLILVIGAVGYISAGLIFDSKSMWLHPLREFALLLSLIGVVSLGYELFLRWNHSVYVLVILDLVLYLYQS